MDTIKLNLSQIIKSTDEQIFQPCQNHQNYQFEPTAKRKLIIMPPTGRETSKS